MWICFGMACPSYGGFGSAPQALDPAAVHTLSPWRITQCRLVARVKPISYTGAFHSSDALLSTIWWTGA